MLGVVRVAEQAGGQEGADETAGAGDEDGFAGGHGCGGDGGGGSPDKG